MSESNNNNLSVSLTDPLEKVISQVTKLFPLWATLFFLIAWYESAPFLDLGSWIGPGLGMIMLFMGLTLSWEDVQRVQSRWPVVISGVVLQFMVMPFSGLMVAKLLGLSAELTIGMILVGSVAGGTASNVLAYLAKGDVALSICMTATSTLIGSFATPFLISLLAHEYIEVNPWALMWGMTKIVLLPVLTGIVISHFFARHLKRLMIFLPLLSMITIILVIAVVVAQNADVMAGLGVSVILAIVLHNSIGFGLGYGVSALLGFDKVVRKTVAIEVGLQNSGLAVVLATQFFTPIAALPGTFFSIWQNIAGSFLATIWARDSQPEAAIDSDEPETESR